MKTLVVVVATVLLLCFGVVQSKHTLHVDKVYPNFGDTVLISGPFTADRIDPAVLNVGSFTINSLGGLTITTDNDITFEGSKFDATAANNIDVNAQDAFSIVAAATLNIASSGVLSFETDNRLQFNSIGASELIAQGTTNLVAGVVDLEGDFLSVSSAEGSIFFNGVNGNFNSPALNLDAQTDVDVSASDSGRISARQSIESQTGKGFIEAQNLFVSAVRNNILIQGNTGMLVDLNNDFEVTAKGGAILASSDGNLNFNINGDASLFASDDLQLNAIDSLVMNIANDVTFDSSGSTYFLSDHGSQYEFDHGLMVAEQTIQQFSAKHFLQTNQGVISFQVLDGPFNSTAVEFTNFFATQSITYNAGDYIRFIGEQGVDMRAERGSLYFTPAGPNAPNGNTPFYFYAINDATFRGSDMLMNTNRFSIISQYSRFATEDTARYSEQTWNLSGDVEFDVNTFFFGSSDVEVNTDGSLSLVSGDDISFSNYYQVGSEILIDTSFVFQDLANNDIVWFAGNFVWNSDSAVTLGANQNSGANLDFVSHDDIRMIGKGSFSATTPDHFSLTTDFDSHYLSPYRGSTQTLNAGDNIDLHGGYYQLQVLDSITFNGVSFIIQSAPNVELLANTEFTIDTTDFEVDASRFIIINGEQTWSNNGMYLLGNTFFGSPPNSDLYFHTDNNNLRIQGTLSVHSADVNILPTDSLSQSTSEFLMTTETEGLISIQTGDFKFSAGDEVNIQQNFPDALAGRQLNFDNQFHFLSQGPITLNAKSDSAVVTIDADYQASFYSTDTELDSDSLTVTAQIVNVLADEGALTFSVQDLFQADSVHYLSFTSQRSSLTIGDDVDQNYISNGNAFVYSYSTYQLHSDDGTDDLQITASNTFAFQGGDLMSNSSNSMGFAATNDITQHGFEGITVGSLSTLDLTAANELRLTAPTVSFLADLDITVTGKTLTTTSEQGDMITFKTTNPASYLELISARDITFWSNDELIVNTKSYSIEATGGDTGTDSIFIQTSAQDSGIIAYAEGQLAINTGGSSSFRALDNTVTGGNVEFSSIFSSFTTTGTTDGGITLFAGGANYDPELDEFVGILHRSLNANIAIGTDDDGVFFSNQKLGIFSTQDAVTHEANTAGISMVSTIGGFIAQSANDFSEETQLGDISNILSGYSLWKASDFISTASDCDATAQAGGNVHVLADRGQVSFVYRSDALQSFQGASWNAQSADQFSFSINGDILGHGSRVEIYADADMRLFSTGVTQGILATSGRNSVYRSSNNNGISFDARVGNVALSAPAGWIQQVASGSTVWHGEGDNVFTGTNTQTLTTLGSIRGEFADQVTLSSSSDFTAIARNAIGFDATSTIDIGTGTAIITVNTGGDTLDNGVFIDSKVLARFHSDVDINLVANNYFAESDGDSSITADHILVESQGTDSIGKDIVLDAANNMIVNSDASITLTGASVRYQYDNELGFSGVSLKIDSSTFIDLQSARQLKFTETGAWTLNSNALSFFTYGDSTWTALKTATFTTSGAISTTSQGNTLFSSSGTTAPDGVVSFATTAGNSPIIFETQQATADFKVESSGAINVGTTAKISITGINGINSFSQSTTGFTAADEFAADSVGDVRLLAEGLGSTITLTGTDPSGSGSRVFFSSTGTVVEQFTTGTISSKGQNWLPDVDLTFEGVQTTDLGGTFTITTADDVTGDFGGSFIYKTGLTTFSAVDSIDYQAFGLDAERGFGMSFTSLEQSIQALANDGNIYFTPSTGMYVTGSTNLFSATKAAAYNTVNGQTFTVTEDPTNIQISSGDNLFLSAKAITVSATGDEPTSGVIDITALGFNVNTNYPSKTDTYGVAFIAGKNALFDVTDSRFVMENMNFGDIVPTPDGSVVFQASGFDQYQRGIEIDSGNILITSELNVVLRAENVNFIELPHDPYQGSAIDESGKYLEALGIDFKLTRHRPTILTVDDQVYTSLGRNINGNGIELTSTVPGADIVFTVETVNINSDATASVLANSLVKMTSYFDTQIVSLRSVNINGHGKSSNPLDWVDSISVRVGSRDPPSFTNGALIGFTPKRDLFMNSLILLRL